MTSKSLGDYSLIKELDKGALGTLFLAEHRFLKRPFALKVLSEEVVKDHGFIERFEKEVTSLYQIDHPNIVKVHNVSCVDGQYFLASDCVKEGEDVAIDLEEYLEKHPGRLKEDILYSIVYQIADALDYVHSKAVAGEVLSHRSLNLSNILVKDTADGPKVFLADFGLTRLLGAGWMLERVCKAISLLMKDSSVEQAELSKSQQSFMTAFSFLAPEQKSSNGFALYADEKSDVYAFGLIVYYLLMRELPQGFFEMPSQRYADLKCNWDKIISYCLQTKPQKRPDHLVSMLINCKEGAVANEVKENVVQEPLTPAASAYQLKLHLKPQEITRPQFEPDPGAIFQTESVVMRYQPKETEAKELDPLMSEMVIITGGAFLRGSNSGGRDESPRHTINLSPFAMDVHPVTNEQFVRFLDVMGGEKDGNNNDMIRLRESRIKRSAGKLNIESGYAKHPVVGVTWYGATAYAKWIGKRLPTEAEWEVAATGGLDDVIYPTGNNIERSQANFFSADTTAVMSYPPNRYGVYDMAGNVYEWCNDWYDFHYYNVSVQEPDNPKGPLQGVYRVLRGGCWKSLKEDLRCAHRHRNNPGVMNGTYGFRCVADVELAH